MVGNLMLFHGTAKIVHPESFDFIEGSFSNIGFPAFFYCAVYISEIVDPLMVIIGFKTRIGGY